MVEQILCQCPKSTQKGGYSEKYDARFCKTCDRWIEGACSDTWCHYCKDRPSRPSEAKELQEAQN